MSDDSSDCSDTNFQPTGSRDRLKNHPDQKRKRRIVMRIEFGDSDESTSASDRTSDDEDDLKNTNRGNGLDDGPSCSINLRNRQNNKPKINNANDSLNDYDSDDFQRNAATRRLRRGGRRINDLDVGFSDVSSSGSEITRQKKPRGKKYILSEDERESKTPSKNSKTTDSCEKNKKEMIDEQGFTSDSSSNDLLEKCPICLLTFRQQEIGSPSTCEHIFCANCIEAWSRNVQTCPIDRIEFQSIIVRNSFENRNIVREINVDPNAKKELILEDDIVEEDEITNCEICNRPDREDVMLLCDHCNHGYHMDCLSPPLTGIPEGSWYCDNCVDSQEEEEDEDLHMLYEDIRDMGIPESRLRVREVQQPRILRTRQNERIRAAIIRRTRSVIETSSSSTQRGRARTTTTTTSRRLTDNRKRCVNGRAKRKPNKRRSRRARQRTYVVEYDLNNFDEKFAIKTTKKVIKRRKLAKKSRTSSRKGKKLSANGVRMTASRRLAEQMGVKHDPKYTSHLSGSAAGLSLFGGANDLEYFSDSDNNDNIDSEIHIETGHGTAVQTSVRISNYGSHRSRKSLLLGRQPNRGIQEPVLDENSSNPDILSSILNMQDRWHSATRNLERVHINSDGTLNIPNVNSSCSDNTHSSQTIPARDINSDPKKSSGGLSTSDINQAPLYSRGGGSANFNRGGGGYNNRSNNNSQNNYRGGGGGGGNQYRHSTSGAGSTSGFGGSSASSSGGMNFNMVGRGNFNFSNNPNYNVPPQNQQNTVSPFQQRNFNQRNLQNQNNQRNNNNQQQRHSLPFSTSRNDVVQQQQQQQQTQNQINPFGAGLTQTCLPPPPHLLLNQQSQPNLQASLGDNSLFGGLPPPMSIPPPHMNVNPVPVRMSVPPPPAPPPVVIPPPANNSLFQLNSDYGNNDDDSNCPNFSIYSHESLQVAKSSETYPTATPENDSNTANVAKEDDENEDLVQLDDDEEIPMPPGLKPTENLVSSELYEPENPTEENDDENEENNNANTANENGAKLATNDDVDDYDGNSSDDEEDKKNKNNDKEQTKHINSEKYDPEEDAMSECSNNLDNEHSLQKENEKKNLKKDTEKQPESVRSSSPAVSDIRLPESETAAANRKGVLELYDDSDWEELDIDRPKETETKSSEKSMEKEKIVENGSEDNEKVNEQDRSYTPCLDENNDPEEHENEDGSTTPQIENSSLAIRNSKKGDESNANIENMDTELISDEEEELDRTNKDRKKSQKNVDKRIDRHENEKVETFKKIGNKQKGRNYRGDKQPLTNNRRGDKKRRSRSLSRSRSVDTYRSRGGRSRSRSPRFRGRGDRSRSRSRSNNKENQGRWTGNFRDGGRFNRNNNAEQQNRLKRRELPRYNVRNVVGHHSPPKTVVKDRYGRDTSRNRRSSRSLSRGRRGPPPRSPFSRSRSRNRRLSISLSPSPSYNRRRSLSHRPLRHFSPPRRRSTSVGRRTPPYRQRSRSPLRIMRSRSLSRCSELRLNGRKTSRHLRGVSPVRKISRGRIRSRSVSMSPRYTPRLSRSRSKTPKPKGRKKKGKESRKKKSKRRASSMSPSPNRRISRQPDPFEIAKPPKKKKRRSPRAKSPIHDDHGWSPSPSPPPQPIVSNYDYPVDKNVSWTPPMQSPVIGVFATNNVRSVSRASKKEKTKRNKKKKKGEKRRETRKKKERKRRTETPEPAPSKEVFASGNNILVSVSFNKETTSSQHTQQTIVTLPPNREDLLSNRRTSVDRVISSSAPAKKRKEKRKKIDTKPVAIIDLERSPFQVEQEPADVIVLTDSEETLEREQHEHRRDRRHSESCPRDIDTESHRNQRSVASGGQRGEKSPERLDTIHEESYDLPQSGGPKTPPEPPVVKFNLQTKKQSKVRNPLHDEDDDIASDGELNERQQQQQQENHRSDLEVMHVQNNQKIGPNTPPESGPCSPDAYDPFEPTKSPSISPRSPTPPPSQLEVAQKAICTENTVDLASNQKHLTGVDNEQQRREQIPGLGGNVAQSASLNPVDLVMALINSKSTTNSAQDLVNKSNESQHNIAGIKSHDDSFLDKGDEGNAITVLSNLLITSGNMQHIPSISSPTPPNMSKKILPGLPKIGSSVGGSSSSGVNMRHGGGTSNNADDSFNINDIESPYSPGSADYEDLFEPPPDTNGNKRRTKRGKPEMFDNLFGSSSPVGNIRLPSYTPSKKHKNVPIVSATRKSKVKVGKSNDENIKLYDDVPNSAVELLVKDKFLRKLNRQERVVEEVKLVLKPRFNKKQITKEDYKEIMRRAVPKICHSRSGEIDPFKIKKLIEAYVKKFRAKHKKLNIVNTGQVSSAVKCAAYLKKL